MRPPVGEETEGRAAAGVALTPVGKEAAEVLRALVKAGRSVILYDASNEAVRDFLVEVRQRMEAFLAGHGDLALQVRPYEILYGDEVVYLERDRERSLALRLYRDGVRRLTFRRGLSWEELSRFISVLGVTFKGIRHQEEDLVTLLWKADLTNVTVEAVAGFRPEDEEGAPHHWEPGQPLDPANETQAAIFEAPYEFDHPAPEFRERGQVAWRPLTPEALARLAAEESEEDTPRQCLVLVRELIAGLRDPDDQLEAGDVLPLVREIRDYLIASGRLEVLLDVAWMLRARAEGDSRHELLLGLFDDRALLRLLSSDASEASLRKLAACLLPEHLNTLLQLAEKGELATPAQQASLAALLTGLGRGQEATLRGHVARLPAALAGVVLTALAALSLDEAVTAAGELLAGGSEETHLHAVNVLRQAPYGARVGRSLVQALASPREEVRLQALQVLAKNRERRALPALLEKLRGAGAAGLSSREANALGITYAFIDPEGALEVFAGWLKPTGLLQRVASRPAALSIAAVAGLGRIPGPAAEELLAWAAEHTPGEAGERARALLARRRGVGEGGSSDG